MKKPPKPAPRRPDIGYIIECLSSERLIKIGRSGNPHKRLETLQGSNPFRLRLVVMIDRGAEMEAHLKAEMREYQQAGEWYRPNLILDRRLREWRQSGRFLKRHRVTQEYFDQHIRPLVLAYLAGREPNANSHGDLVARYLARAVPDIERRLDELMAATLGAMNVNLVFGFAPLEASDVVELPLAPSVPDEANAA